MVLQHLAAFSFSQLALSASLTTLKDLSYGKGFSELLLLEEKGKFPKKKKKS